MENNRFNIQFIDKVHAGDQSYTAIQESCRVLALERGHALGVYVDDVWTNWFSYKPAISNQTILAWINSWLIDKGSSSQAGISGQGSEREVVIIDDGAYMPDYEMYELQSV